MIRRVSHRTHDDARDLTVLRLECGHVAETKALRARLDGSRVMRPTRAECKECDRERAQDLLRGRYGHALRELVDRYATAGALASQPSMEIGE